MKIFDNIFKVTDNNDVLVTGLNDELDVVYIYNTFIQKNRSVLVVVSSTYEASLLYESLNNYTDKTLFFPMDDFITSEALAISPDFLSTRMFTLNALLKEDKYIVITNLMGYLRYLPTKKNFINAIIDLRVNTDIKVNELLAKLNNIGYNCVDLVTESGTYAFRGFVIDIFPIGEDNPIRITLWGDTIDSIKYYNADSQLSISNVDNVTINPSSEFVVDNAQDDIICKQKYLANYTKVVNIGDYLEDYYTCFVNYNDIRNNYIKLREDIIEYDNSKDSEGIKTNYMFDLNDIKNNNSFYINKLDDVVNDLTNIKKEKFISHDVPLFNGNIEEIIQEIKKYLAKKMTVILCIPNKNMAKKVVQYLDSIDFVLTNEGNIIDNKLNIINKNVNKGFIIDNYVVISANNLYQKEEVKKYKAKYTGGQKIKDVNSIVPGDFVVHDYFGIGMYDSLCSISKNGVLKDYLKIIYANNDSLYIPASKIDNISKYASRDGYIPKLNSLSNDNWRKKTSALKKKINDIAVKLLKISAEREALKGFAFAPDDEDQILFESEFQYTETTDQIIAVNKIKAEMEKEHPMDMLLCGDVGYGKTEVAFRAMFKAVNSSKQVAYLCPTTILSNQQYQSALERFKNFPVSIAILNRFVSKKDQEITLKKLKEGKIDILFGTHRILSNDVEFKDLGLLVVDEEQRFGVTHKEKIKELKANVDVLTLSATPIPRTLQMSLTGLRTLALIETPPVDRYPVQTYVIPFNNSIIKDGIYKELARNGQVFILYNRVDSILKKVEEINKLVPEARIQYAHGQMSREELENRMNDFINHEFDVLVCTTIIETGIDIPNANTLFIVDADNFGLSQLYQIRGRIGRSNKIGYAYLMYDNHKVLNDIAVKRLNVIKEFTELGSGFKIAMRDLSIRGAGDILGSEQSGFIDAVGIDLYLKMLNNSVKRLAAGESLDDLINEEEDEPENNMPLLNLPMHISDNYKVNDNIKLEIHKKINEISSLESLNNIKTEIEDRFGKIDNDMELYMYEEWFEKLAKKFNINKVNETKTMIEFCFDEEISKLIDGEKLFYLAYDICKYFRFSYKNNKIYVILDTLRLEKHYVYYINLLLQKIKEELSL